MRTKIALAFVAVLFAAALCLALYTLSPSRGASEAKRAGEAAGISADVPLASSVDSLPVSRDWSYEREMRTLLDDPRIMTEHRTTGMVNAVKNVKHFVEGGGWFLSTGRSNVFPALIGEEKSPVFYSRSQFPHVVGLSFSTDTRILSPFAIEHMAGMDRFVAESSTAQWEHSTIKSAGRGSKVLATASYLFEDVAQSPFGAYLTYYFVDAPTCVEFEHGTNGGRIIYSSTELSRLYNEHTLGRAFLDSILDGILFRDKDPEEIGEALDAYDSPVAPLAVNRMNLNMVCYNGEIAVPATGAGTNVSYVFAVGKRSNRRGLAPEIDASGPREIVVSLYDPFGERVATRRAPEGASAVSVAVPANRNRFMSGNWKFVVEKIGGYPGERMVLAAALKGLHGVGADLPGGSPGATAVKFQGAAGDAAYMSIGRRFDAQYPRGVVRGVFYHQLGDGRQTISPATAERIAFGPLIHSGDVGLWRVGDDLELDVAGTRDRITVSGWLADPGALRAVSFFDGTRWERDEVRNRAIVREPEVVIVPVSVDEYVGGTPGDDALAGSGRNCIFFGGWGDDTITCDGGSNVFYYAKGDGNDTIVNKRAPGQTNVLRFHRGILLGDVVFSRSGDDMLLSLPEGSVRIRGWYADEAARLDRVELPGGIMLDYIDMEKLASGRSLSARRYYYLRK